MSALILAISTALLSDDSTALVSSESEKEIELVAAARRGRPAAWTELYHRYARAVHACILARVPPDDAGDWFRTPSPRPIGGSTA